MGWAGSSAEGTQVKFLPANRMNLPAITLGWSVVTGIHRNIFRLQFVNKHPDSGPCRINDTVLRRRVKSRTGHFTCPASGAFIRIDLNYFIFFRLSRHFRSSSPLYRPKPFSPARLHRLSEFPALRSLR